MALRTVLCFPLGVFHSWVPTDSLKPTVCSWWPPLLRCTVVSVSEPCLAWLFFLAHMSCKGPAWDQLCFLCRAMQQTEKAHLGALSLAKARMPSFPSVTERISCRGKKIQGASSAYLTFSPLQSISGWIGRGREGDCCRAVCCILEATLTCSLDNCRHWEVEAFLWFWGYSEGNSSHTSLETIANCSHAFSTDFCALSILINRILVSNNFMHNEVFVVCDKSDVQDSFKMNLQGGWLCDS